MFGWFKKKKVEPVKPFIVPTIPRVFWTTDRKDDVIIDFDLIDVFSISRTDNGCAEIGHFVDGDSKEWYVPVTDQSYIKLLDDYQIWKNKK